MYPQLQLENQLCFALYTASREITKKYMEFLEPLDLTYTQYLTMLVLWENESMLLSDICRKLFLNSNTITPLIKKLEKKGYVQKTWDTTDDRKVWISLTKEGEELQEKAKSIPNNLSCKVSLDAEKAKILYKLLYEIINNENKNE